MRALAAALFLLAAPAFADETTVEIVAYDRLANVLVMKDKTVWELGPKVLVPADLKAGDRVRIDFVSAGDSGWGRIRSLERVEN